MYVSMSCRYESGKDKAYQIGKETEEQVEKAKRKAGHHTQQAKEGLKVGR